MLNKTEERKKLLTIVLNKSFVDDYGAYKSIVVNINKDFKRLEIDYEFNYDQFCISFLNKSLNEFEEANIFKHKNFKDFYTNFWNFNIFVIKNIIMDKFDELGYDYSKYKNLINDTNYIPESINNISKSINN